MIPGLGRLPGGGHSNPLQYSCLEKPMDREVWRATVRGVAKSRTQLSDYYFALLPCILSSPRLLASQKIQVSFSRLLLLLVSLQVVPDCFTTL